MVACVVSTSISPDCLHITYTIRASQQLYDNVLYSVWTTRLMGINNIYLCIIIHRTGYIILYTSYSGAEINKINNTCYKVNDDNPARNIKVIVCLQKSDDAAREPGTGVSCVETVHESSAAQVVGVGVHDHGAPEDAVGSDQRDQRVLERELRHARVVSLDVAQVAGVSVIVLGTTVLFLRRKKNH